VRHPGFWAHRDGVWLQRGMFGEYPLPADWPVYVSHAEASAYARWAGKSLPSEAQWRRSAFGTPGGEENPYPWGSEEPDASRGNFDFRRWDPAPVAAFPKGDSAFGVMDLVGNGWEWTSTLFSPFPGFKPFPFYPGYSADFFDNKHFVMKGGSARTASCMLRHSFRNWFQPHYPYVYAGFRCVSH
ncbi:MAG TPA: SUMF1/EgtB/PvdO family nonheme iron enzyme, partial [Terriglobales bacterium]|nr:SUMF1/EgtB/PvdO family nonheme iron enzyme [Terriglobales bacterium]